MDNCFGSKTPIPFWYPSLDQKPGRVVSLFWVYNPFFFKLCYPFNVLNFMFPSLYWYSLVTVWLWLVFILCISRVIQTTLDILAFFNTLLLSFSFLFVLVFFLLSLVVICQSFVSMFCVQRPHVWFPSRSVSLMLSVSGSWYSLPVSALCFESGYLSVFIVFPVLFW